MIWTSLPLKSTAILLEHTTKLRIHFVGLCDTEWETLALYHLCTPRKELKVDLKVKTAADLRSQIWL